MVSCDVTGRITLGTKLKRPIFTLYLLLNLEGMIFIFSEVYVLVICFQIKLTKIFATKGWSDQEVNTQFEKDLNHKPQGQIFIER